MPLLSSPYRPGLLWRQSHFSTIYSGLFRSVSPVPQKRERIVLDDGDFMDLDWSSAEKPAIHAAIVVHGLEGNAQRPYMLGMAKILNQHGIDACCMNLRGCSGEPNRSFGSYHSGATEDLEIVVRHIQKRKPYSGIILVGFSLGGNLVLKYLGEPRCHAKILAAVGISVPCDLYDSLQALNRPLNYFYSRRFLKTLVAKAELKAEQFPELLSKEEVATIKSLRAFDEIYTSRAHGFVNAMDYYVKSSCKPSLSKIRIPTLLINAKNDSFLGPKCYPTNEAKANPYLHLELPDFGGHVGFMQDFMVNYSEQQAIKFVQQVL